MLPTALRRLSRTVDLLEALTARKPLERQVVELALKVGLEVAQRVLPKSAALVVRTAVAAARGIGRAMER
ncbi:MAG TPA: hypothetical protein VHM02_13315 [Thermoanaerobaculia bacterium]|nr:hypothetical protein [Thermoanaerobaculia bacterium]